MARRDASPRVRGVVFDLDGTLVDSFDGLTTAANAARARFGLPPLGRDAVTRMVGNGVEHLVAQAVGAERIAEAVPIFREVYARVCETETRALPDAGRTLRALAVRGVRSGVASNKSLPYSEGILSRLGLRPLLTAVDGPESAGALKPDPAMILHCLRTLGVAPREAVYVGDMPQDVDAGGRAGVRVVLVAGGASAESALRAQGVPVLARLFDLIAELER